MIAGSTPLSFKMEHDMKSLCLSILSLSIPFILFSQSNSRIKEYFNNQNIGLTYYFVDSLPDSALTYFLKAEKLYPKERADILYLMAQIYSQRNERVHTVPTLKSAILRGYKPRFIDWNDNPFKKMAGYQPYEELKATADSLYASTQASLDMDFIDLIQLTFGKDQAIRTIELSNYGMAKEVRSQLIKATDSANYLAVQQYFIERNPDNLPKRLGTTYSIGLNMLIRHWISSGLDSAHNYFFQQYLEREISEGRLFDNMSLTHDLDYKSSQTGYQIYGTNTTWGNNGKTVFMPIKNINTIDSLRKTVNLPPLKVSAIMYGIELPDGYKYNK